MKQSQQSKPKQSKRLPLPALILALFILVVLFLFMPVIFYPPHIHDHAQRPESQVRSLCQALIIYAYDNKDQFPGQDQWGEELVEAGLIEADMLISQTAVSDGDSYYLVAKSNTFDSTEILVYENPEHWIDYVLVGFVDMHVEEVDHETFERMLADQLAAQEKP